MTDRVNYWTCQLFRFLFLRFFFLTHLTGFSDADNISGASQLQFLTVKLLSPSRVGGKVYNGLGNERVVCRDERFTILVSFDVVIRGDDNIKCFPIVY